MLTQKKEKTINYLRLFHFLRHIQIFKNTSQHQTIRRMATATKKIHCVICNKEKSTLKCGGCSQDFCYNHWDTHRQELNKQLDEIEINHDLFRQSFTEYIERPNNNTLIQQINQWEQNSIKKDSTNRRRIETSCAQKYQ
jgi:hypothetical protein